MILYTKFVARLHGYFCEVLCAARLALTVAYRMSGNFWVHSLPGVRSTPFTVVAFVLGTCGLVHCAAFHQVISTPCPAVLFFRLLPNTILGKPTSVRLVTKVCMHQIFLFDKCGAPKIVSHRHSRRSQEFQSSGAASGEKLGSQLNYEMLRCSREVVHFTTC